MSAEEAESFASRLEVRLAESEDEILAAQSLRYRVFYEEMGAKPCEEMASKRLDFDAFDAVCDHLLVLDPSLGAGGKAVVGTYRLMMREVGEKFGRFYTASEYDISKAVAAGGNFMELGRSCVDPRYRNRSTMNMLWSGIATYVRERNVELMFGCASMPGIDPDALSVQLSYLYHWHLAPDFIRPKALPDLYVSMNRVAKETIDPKRVLAQLPPLIKGYLRLGGFFGDGAVIDHQFNTTDVCVLVKTELVTDKYVKHYDRNARDGSA